MKVRMIRDGEAILALTAEECDLISNALKDEVPADPADPFAEMMARVFGSLPTAVRLTVDAE